MTKQTKLRKHAHNLIQGKKHQHTTITRGSVAASVAIASTLALASVAQAEPLKNASAPAPANGSGSSVSAPKIEKIKQDATQLKKTASVTTTTTSVASTYNHSDKPHTPPLNNNEQPQPLPNSDQVITPNAKNPDPTTKIDANKQVEREKDNKKTYTFTVSYCVEGYHQKQLLQPTEFTFTEDELNKISDPKDKGLYIPIVETKGYRAQRGQYIKQNGKYVRDNTQDASIQTYIKIDRQLITDNKNAITSTDTHIVSTYTVEYRPKTITYYVRHMLQDANDPNKFNEYTKLPDTITVPDDQGTPSTIHVSKVIGAVGQNMYAQPIALAGYSPEPNLVNSPIPDDDDYADVDANDPANTNHKKKYLVLELRYLLNTHVVSYDTKGGTAVQAKTFRYGMKVDAVPDPARKGYIFDGWVQEEDPSDHQSTLAHERTTSDPNKKGSTSEIASMPDHDVRFVAKWRIASPVAQYHINIWVQKADLVDPKNPNNKDNYDFIGQQQKTGKSDGTIAPDDLKLNDSQISGLDWPDSNLRDKIKDQTDFDKYFMDADTNSTPAQFDDSTLEHEYFDSQEMRPRNKIRPDGTTVVNKVFNRRVYELIFANPDIVDKNGKHRKMATSDHVDHTIIKKDGKIYDDRDEHKLYKVHYRFGQTVDYTTGLPTDAETQRYGSTDDTYPLSSFGWRVANYSSDPHFSYDRGFYIDTPPYRFDLKHFIAPQGINKKIPFSQNDVYLFGKHLGTYQRVLVADGFDVNWTRNHPDSLREGASVPIHVIIKLETEASARRNDEKNREYVVSEHSYTKYDTNYSDYTYTAPAIEGYEVVPDDAKQNLNSENGTILDQDDYLEHLEDDLGPLYEQSGTQDDFTTWVKKNFPQLKYVYTWPLDKEKDDDDDPNEGDLDTEFDANGYLCFHYKRKQAPVRFAVDKITPVQDDKGKQAIVEEPFDTNLKKFAPTYNGNVTKNAPAQGKQFASSYTFKLNGKTYTFKRPDNLPEDYEFAGWSLDPAGTNKLVALKNDGTPYTPPRNYRASQKVTRRTGKSSRQHAARSKRHHAVCQLETS